ncbi:branched-chain amino acid ABC transporter substrate-binding protein [Sinorhizobium saheli]|uniref:Branched chain amino acid ABC transporter substrate-binding protein n=1 Tax=Sinorhizobium saheli TaxID=36856 RepID=A0A178YBB8_SINSA|nr:branched-chain amino acid ABC transporter substrate-binding protein [Sinorhizobium saheli]MQW86581.1 ABC transporter substrate-binding protein [Sinorhizobium saheli]OAP44769.1 branched chain amino acid ABC transporter substrate-binding protein [Sinorhizobium saheli]
MRLSLLTGLTLAAGVAFAPLAHADITIGVITPLTGPVAAFGEQVKNGAEAAVQAINDAGGVKGEKLVIKIVDDAGEPKQAVSVANQLAGEGVQYVVGPVLSGTSMPASDVLAENGILMVTPTATTPELTTRGLWNVFRTCGRDDQQAVVAADYVVKNFKGKRVAVLHDKGAYGKGLADGFKTAINAGGITEVVYEGLNTGEKDFSAIITRLKAEKVDVVYFGGYHAEAGLMVRQMHDQGVEAQLIGGDGLSNTEFWAIGGNAAAGTIYTNASDATRHPAAAPAIEALNAKNIPAEAFTLNAYAAVQVIKTGIEKAGNADDPNAVATAIKSGEAIDTVIGKLTYGETGDLTSPSFSLYKWEAGKSVAVE